LKTLFPTESINSHVRDIPSLASFAERRLKPGRGLGWEKCFQEFGDWHRATSPHHG
jgi:hypothetical protein